MSAPPTEKLSHPQRQERRERIAAFVRGGGSVEAAAQEFKVSLRTARDACREFDVELPSRSVAAAG